MSVKSIILNQSDLMNRLFCSFTPKDKLEQRLSGNSGAKQLLKEIK
jgi:hypothetical protein